MMRQLAQTRAPEAAMGVPSIGETWEWPAGAPARRTRTGREDIAGSLGHDWQNAYAQFVTGLKRDLARIEDEKAREAALAKMREVLESYSAHRDGRRKRAAESASRER